MSINHATIGIPTFGQLQTAVKALGYDVFDCIDHAKKAGVADWMDPDALRYAREFVPFIEEVAPKGKLSLGTKVWFKCLNYSSGTRHGACGAMCFTWGDKSHSLTLKHNDPNYDHEWVVVMDSTERVERLKTPEERNLPSLIGHIPGENDKYTFDERTLTDRKIFETVFSMISLTGSKPIFNFSLCIRASSKLEVPFSYSQS